MRLQLDLAGRRVSGWSPPPGMYSVGGCFVCFGRGGSGPGAAGDAGWAAAVAMVDGRLGSAHVSEGAAGSAYAAGLLAAREGPFLEAAVASLRVRPDVVLVNATGRDHPRRAGLALQLGWVVDVPTVGVTHRPLLATGLHPGRERGSRSPLLVDGQQVGWWLRTRAGALPLAVSPGWRTDLDVAPRVVLAVTRRARTPEPIRQARRLARTARSRAGSGTSGGS